jgi:hypothetical protein
MSISDYDIASSSCSHDQWPSSSYSHRLPWRELPQAWDIAVLGNCRIPNPATRGKLVYPMRGSFIRFMNFCNYVTTLSVSRKMLRACAARRYGTPFAATCPWGGASKWLRLEPDSWSEFSSIKCSNLKNCKEIFVTFIFNHRAAFTLCRVGAVSKGIIFCYFSLY